jgi:hypothetical protein
MTNSEPTSRECADLLESLGRHRWFLRFTVRDLTDEQAAQQTTASALCLGGLIKHVALTERQWVNFMVDGPSAMSGTDGVDGDGDGEIDWAGGFRMLEGETLAGLLDDYEQVASRTDALVVRLPDLDASHPLPEAPKRWDSRLSIPRRHP